DKNKNLIPVYETEESLSPIFAFPSDDYYGLLSPNEGNKLQGSLDIDIGRLTVQDLDQLKAVVDKIIHYDSNPDAMRDFRNRVVFVTDDIDESWEYVFLQHSEETLWKDETATRPTFNTEKVYLDAYTQITTPGGQRSPDCQEAINNNMFKGNLIINYVGHGGPRGWAQERILNANEDVPTWSNFERLPLMITATCSFAGYDNPTNFTAGEQVLALDKGGAVGLFATVRSVYASANDVLTKSVFNEIYKKVGYNGRALGEILRTAKNNSGTDTDNNRKFAMLGDPSQRLMIPQYNISTTAINGKSLLNSTVVDTAGAMSRVQIEGIVTDSMGKILDWFDGKIYPTIFDKEITLKAIPSLGFQQSFKVQNKILFKGAATVKKGKFKFECIIPKDIDYNYGFAKISYYATNNTFDATGFDRSHLVIGGAALNPIKDDKPPLVEVFMDNESFISGGYTSNNPTLLVRLNDDVGFNVSGSSVGHDMKAVLDENTQNTFRLNEFYEAATDDFRKGQVKYPLSKLKDGVHKISVKAWDTANNPGEGFTEFVVAGSGKSALEHVLNYPNPFTTNTSFQFRHHLSEVNLKVQIRVFSVSGRLVKTIFADAFSENGRVTDISWDGKDDFGDDLGKGVYLYKVHIESTRNSNLAQESNFEKLVILK
ncbi:MAG: type IX secretion system sortase PorU, partial [Saprospiraceae bacterium]